MNEKEEIAKRHLIIEDVVKGLIIDNFYGQFQINFENGKITHCKKTETIKL